MKKRGKGIASMYYPIGSGGKPNAGSAFIKMNHDGTVILFIGAVDIGQSSTTAMGQIAAEVLGIDFQDVRVVSADTELTPYDHGTGACRVTYVMGNAVKKAAEKAKDMLLQSAAFKLGLINTHKLRIANKRIYLEGFTEQSISIIEAAWVSERERGRPVIAAESFSPSVSPIDPVHGQGNPFETYVFATQIAEVEVDTETGEVEILRVIAVHDCGKAINPLVVEGQINGGVVMGQGYALMEEIIEDSEGNVLNSNFVDYHIPTAVDAPGEIIIDIVEDPDENGPFGAKGVGEPTQLPTAPAIINAIYDAVGVRIKDLPATPEKVLKYLQQLS